MRGTADSMSATGDDPEVIVRHDGLPDAAARRLATQLARAYRGTYGAKTGLRTVVTSIARQLLLAGLPYATVAQTLERCVLEHPARHQGDGPHLLTGEPHTQMLVELTRACVDEAARSVPKA